MDFGSIQRPLMRGGLFVFACVLLVAPPSVGAASTFTVGSYNLENYTGVLSAQRSPKPEISKQKVHESILALRPDILGLQEIGPTNTLLELRATLRESGLDYPYWEHVKGYDTNIFVAVLSRYPIVARRSHSQDGFLLYGRRFRMTRGIVEVDVQVDSDYTFTLLVAHLKSKRASAQADESELREQEALLLREKVDARLQANPNANIIVVGDLNDTKDSRSLRTIIGKGKTGLVDTRPAERNGDNATGTMRQVTWTHYYAQEDSYSRFDYILVSRGMAREWQPAGTFVLAVPNWGTASDHRPIIATFVSREK